MLTSLDVQQRRRVRLGVLERLSLRCQEGSLALLVPVDAVVSTKAKAYEEDQDDVVAAEPIESSCCVVYHTTQQESGMSR